MLLKDGIGIKAFYTEKFSTVTLTVLFRTRLCKSNAALNALLAQIFDSGCKGLSGVRSLNNFLEVNGDILFKSDIVKKGEEHIIELFTEFRPEYTEKVFIFLGQVINNPDISDRIVERKKLVIEEVIKNRKSDKKAFALERCIESMCAGEPFGVSGDGYKGDLDNVTLPQIDRHYADVTQQSPVEIISSGKLQEETIADYAEKYFCLNARQNELKASVWESDKKTANVIFEKSDIVQAKLCIGCRTNINPVGDDWYRAIVANELFGCSADSSLFETVREKEGLCYYINSILYRYKGLMVVQAGVDEKNCKKTCDMVKKALCGIQQNGFDADSVKKAAHGAAQRYSAMRDYPGAMLDFYLGQLIAGDDTDMDNFIKGIKSVEEINSFFEKTFIDTIFVLESGGTEKWTLQ